jgi:glyoxylase-like metal-dependent hydrolase (beta-lactamase superfamily II)
LSRLVDVRHLGREHVIGAWLVDGCLVDCGPTSSLEGLLEGLGDDVPRRLLLTHIHLDHSGAAGTLVQRWPDLEVWVHERGAKHLADPSKLVSSASRLYGDDMERLWGEIAPVPEENLRVLQGGERIDGWRVEYTPGHASHHVSFLHEASGTAFAGDTAGVRIAPSGVVLAPTPPPDVDLEAWPRSIDTIAGWRPERVVVTHFGAWEDVDEQLGELREALDRMAGWARELGDADAFADRVRAEIASCSDPETAQTYEQAMPAWTLYPGLERALRRVSSPQ